MGRSIRVIGAVAAGLLLAGSLGAPALAATTGTIQGTFTTFSGSAIAGGSVTAYDATESWLANVSTDSKGHYRLTGIDPGPVLLQFQDADGRMQWSPGQPTSSTATKYSLTAGGSLTVDEKQVRLGSIAGTLTDPSGAPVSATVAAQSVDGPSWISGSTDYQDGSYRLDLVPGTYKVNFQWDAVTQWSPQKLLADDAATITVTAGQTTALNEVALPTGTVTGHLDQADGTPLAHAGVQLHPDDPSRFPGYTSTDDNGDFSFGQALPGDYTVSFSLGSVDQYLPATLIPEKAGKYAVTAGHQTTITGAQMKTSTVRGRLVDTGGQPVGGYHVSVTLNSDETWVNYSATTDDDGQWSVGGVYAGGYRVSFITPNYSRTQWAYGSGTEHDAAVINVDAGTSTEVDDVWAAGATLVVDAVDSVTGAPVSNWCAWVDNANSSGGCTTDSRLSFGDLPAGDFHVSLTNNDPGGYYLGKSDVPVALTAGQTTTVKVPLVQGGKVAFTTTDRATGKPVASACGLLRVLGHGGLGDGEGDCTDATGRAASIATAAGTYELFVTAPSGLGHQWVGPNGGTGDQRAAAKITVTPGQTVAAPAVLLDPPGSIGGVVTDAAGAPVSGVGVSYHAWDFGAGPSRSVGTDATGHYTLTGLGPYSWPLVFTSSDGNPRQWSGNAASRFDATAIPVTSGATATYDIALSNRARMTGSVTAPGATQWRLNAYDADTGDVTGVFDSSAAGAGGSYSVPLPGGAPYKISVSTYDGIADKQYWYDGKSGLDDATTVDVPASGSTTLDLTVN